MTQDSDPYDVIDPVLLPWARRHDLKVGKRYRDDPVRVIALYDRSGNMRAQLGFDLPDVNGQIRVMAAEVDLSSPSKWNRREERVATLATLEDALEQLRTLMVQWSGPEAFSA
jgi:hypothetical protein